MRLTVEENNLIRMYDTGTRARTLAGLRATLHFIDDPDMRAITSSAVDKLDGTTDATYAANAFEPAHPVLYTEDASKDEVI